MTNSQSLGGWGRKERNEQNSDETDLLLADTRKLNRCFGHPCISGENEMGRWAPEVPRKLRSPHPHPPDLFFNGKDHVPPDNTAAVTADQARACENVFVTSSRGHLALTIKWPFPGTGGGESANSRCSKKVNFAP